MVIRSARAANQTWDGGSIINGLWSTLTNWLGDAAAPGAIGTTTNADVATFDSPMANSWGASAGNPIVIDNNWNVGGISFTGAAGNYFIGSTGGNTLKVSSGGSIQIRNTLTATNAVQTINAPLQIQGAGGTYSFANNSANGSGAGAGTLNFGGSITGGASGATVLTLSGSNTNANTISGAIGNGAATTLGVTKTGAGTWVLTGPNIYSGPTTISQGTLVANSSAALGDGSATNTLIFNGGTLQASGTITSPSTRNVTLTSTGIIDTNANSVTIAGVMSGPGGLTKTGAGTLTLSGTNTYGGATTISGGTIKLQPSLSTISGFGANGTGWTNNNGATIAANVLTLTDNLGSERRSAFLQARVGTGAFTSSFIYTAAGNRAADGVAFVLQNDSRGLNAVGGDGGALGYGTGGGGTAITPSAAVEFNLFGTVGTRYATNGAFGTYTANTPVNLASGNPIQVNLSYDGANILTLLLTDTVTSSIYSIDYTVGSLATTTGGGTAFLGFTGATGGSTATQTISNFVFTGVSAFNILPASTAVTMASGTTLDLNGAYQQIASLADVTVGGTSGHQVLLGGGSLLVGDASSTVFSGIISGSGSFTKVGSGTLTLSGANSYTGWTSVGIGGGVSGGTLLLSGSGTIGNAATSIYAGTLDLNGTTQTITALGLGGGASGSTATVAIGAGQLNLGGDVTYSSSSNPNGATISGASGLLTLGGNRSFTVEDSTAASADLTISTIIRDNSTVGGTARNITKLGAGTLVLSGANTYTGATTIGVTFGASGGTLQLSGAGKISNASTTVFAGTLDLNGTTQTITSLSVGGGNSSTTATVAIGSGQLNLGGDVSYSAGSNANGAVISGAGGGLVTLGGNRSFFVADSSTALVDLTVSAIIRDNPTIGGTARTLTKTGPGTLVLSGANLYTGTTTVSAGTLTARSASALGSGGVAVSANAVLNYAAAADTALGIGGTLSVTGGTTTALGGSLGSTTTSARINATGAATATGAVKVNVNLVSGFTPLAGTNNYTLVHGGAGSSLNGATYSFGTVYNNNNFILGAPAATTTDLTIAVTSATALTTAYWKGVVTGATNVWAVSNGNTQSNWVATLGGADQPLVPGATTDLIFSNSAITTAPTGTVLGADMTVKSLTQQDTTNSVALGADGYTLTITPVSAASGITLNSGARSLTLSSNVVLGAAQSWTNNSSSSLTVSGPVSNGGNLLTVGGTFTTSISGVMSGAGGLTKTGSSNLNLSGINTFGGALNIQQGTLQISAAPNDANTDGVLGNSATSVSLGNVGGLTATVLYALSSPGSTNRNFTMVTGGTGDFNVSGNLTLSGVIDGGGNLTKTVNTGTLQFSGSASNSYGGLTTVSAGTLLLGKSGAAQAIAGGGLTINSGVLVQYNGTSTDMMGTGAVTINGSAQLDFNGANDTIGNVTIAASGAGADTTPLKNTAGGGSLTIGTLGITPVAGFTSVLNAGSGGTLTLGGTVTFTAATTGRARITGTTLALGGDRIFNIGLGTGIGFDLEISSAISGSGNSLTKQGTGRLLLSGANSYTGATTISAGTVTVTNAAAFNPSTGGAVSMATGTTLNYIASTDAQLGLHSTLTITGGVGTVLGTSLGATATSAEINVTGAATATGSVTVNFYPVGNTLAGGIYTLVHGGAGSSLNGATYALGTIYNNTNWTASGLGATATDLTVAISTVTPLTTAYWKGGLAGATNVWAVSNGSSSNWAATAGGVAQALVPGAGADVIISATTPTTAPTATFLGANMSIQSLTIADLINGLGLNADGTTLTLGTGGLTMNANVPASTIAANVILGGNQTWTNSSSNGLTMSGVVSGASNLIKTGTGTVTLSGTNSFTGSISIAGGVLSISSDGHLGNIANGISLAAGGTLRFGSAATLTAARLITVNGSVGNPSGLSLGSSVTQILGASQLTGSGVAKVSLTGGTTPGILSMEGVNAGFTGNMIVGAPGEFVGQFFFLARFWDQRRCDAASAKCRHAGQREQPDDQ